MATKIRGITVEIGGDTSPLAKAFNDLNRQISSTQKELADVEKALKLNPESTVLLTQKQQLLSKQLADTRDKFSKLHDIEKELEARRAADGSNENLEKQLRAVAREISSTEAAIGKLETAYTDTSAKVYQLSGKLDDNGKKHITLKERISNTIGKLKEFITGNDEATENIKDNATEINSKLEIWDKFSGKVGDLARNLWDLVSASGRKAEDLNTLSAITGLSTEELQKIEYASNLIDVSGDKINDALKDLSMNMYDASQGTGEATEAFALLGFSVTDGAGKLKESGPAFYDIIDRLNGVKNETERNALAMKIFGESAVDLAPLIKAGSQVLKDYGDDAERAGLIMSQDALDGANEFNKALDILKSTVEGVRDKIGVELAGKLTAFVENVTPMIEIVADLFGIISKIPAPVLAGLVTFVLVIITALKVVAAVSPMLAIANISMSKTMLIILAIAGILALIVGLIALIKYGAKDAGKAIEDVAESAQDATSGFNPNEYSRKTNIPQYANGTNYHRGGLAFITEYSPEQLSMPDGTNMVVMPRGTRVNPNVSLSSGGDVYNITIDAKNVREFNDIVRMAKSARRERRAM